MELLSPETDSITKQCFPKFVVPEEVRTRKQGADKNFLFIFLKLKTIH